jgi:hypothetical protein
MGLISSTAKTKQNKTKKKFCGRLSFNVFTHFLKPFLDGKDLTEILVLSFNLLGNYVISQTNESHDTTKY